MVAQGTLVRGGSVVPVAKESSGAASQSRTLIQCRCGTTWHSSVICCTLLYPEALNSIQGSEVLQHTAGYSWPYCVEAELNRTLSVVSTRHTLCAQAYRSAPSPPVPR
jgi:hypothetical protein